LLLGGDDLHTRREELRADEQRHHATDEEEQNRRDQVHVPDRLVVGGGDPPNDHVALLLRAGSAQESGLARRKRRGASGTGHAQFPSSVSASFLRPSGLGRFWRRLYASLTSPTLPAASRPARYWSYSLWLTTSTLKSIAEWYSPQSSAHLPS